MATETVTPRVAKAAMELLEEHLGQLSALVDVIEFRLGEECAAEKGSIGTWRLSQVTKELLDSSDFENCMRHLLGAEVNHG